jgi:hypothetical protein
MEDWFSLPTTNEAPQNTGGGSSTLIASLINAESAGNPNAISPKGARGLMQVMPATGAEVAQQLGMTDYDLMNPDDNQKIGTAYFNQMLDQFGDPQLASAAYNAGPNRVKRAIQQAGTTDPALVLALLPKETQNYVPKVMAGASDYAKPQVQPSPASTQNSMDWFNLPDAPISENITQIPEVPSYTINDAAAEVMDYLPFGKKLAAGISALYNYDTPGQYEYALGKINERAQNFRDNAGTAAKAGAFVAGAIPQMYLLPAGAMSTALRATGAGALLGMGDSLDDAEFGVDATDKGLKGALLGGTGGIIGYGVAKGAGALANTQYGQRAINDISEFYGRMSNEAGAVGRKVASGADDALPNLTKGEAFLLDYAKDVPAESLAKGASTIQQGIEAGVPVRVTEAVNSPSIYNLADDLANKTPTADVLGTAYRDTAKASSGRIKDTLLKQLPDALDGEGNVILSDDAIKSALGGVTDKLKTTRGEIADTVYTTARQSAPEQVSQETTRLLSTPTIKQILRSEAKAQADLTGKAVSEFNPTSFDSINSVKQKLFQLETSARKKVTSGALVPSDKTPEYYAGLRNQLVKSFDFPEYQTARGTYAELSKPINKVIGSIDLETGKSTKGLFTDLMKINELAKPSAVGDKLMSYRPDVIGKIRKAVIETDPELEANLLAGVRGHLEQKINKGGVSRTIKYITQDGADSLKKAVGNEKYSALQGYIDLEGLVQDGIKATAQNSKTALRQSTNERSNLIMDGINAIMSGNWRKTLIGRVVAGSANKNDAVRMQVAEILADPVAGKATLERLVAYRKVTDPRIANVRQFLTSFGTTSGKTIPTMTITPNRD